jgi:uncharacterized damage-inducible protein DinB
MQTGQGLPVVAGPARIGCTTTRLSLREQTSAIMRAGASEPAGRGAGRRPGATRSSLQEAAMPNAKLHPLVSQLRFTRSEFMRAIKNVNDEEARQRFPPLNCISWNVGHMAWQEQAYFIGYGQGRMLLPDINREFATGSPASTPPLAEMLAAWQAITEAADPWLDSLTTARLQQPFTRRDGQPGSRANGSLLQRVIYHYWFHTGENFAIRQLLGHTRLPQFVGSIDEKAPYRPE